MEKKELIISAMNNVLGTSYVSEEIQDETSLVDDLLFDSISLVRLIVELEECFDISMDDIDDFSLLETYKTLSNYIEELLDIQIK